MNTIFCTILIAGVLIFGTCSSYGQGSLKTERPSVVKKPSESLGIAEMREPLNNNLDVMEIAKREITEFQEEVKGGKIKVENNNGIWTAVSGKKEKIVRLANYTSQNGPMNFFTKRVYSDSTHSNEVHMLGYDIYFHANGQIKIYLRRDWNEGIKCFKNGRIDTFHSKKPEGQYIAKWDTNGCLVQEGTSKGLIENKKGNGNETGDISQPPTNQTAVVVPQIPESGKTNDLGISGNTGKP